MKNIKFLYMDETHKNKIVLIKEGTFSFMKSSFLLLQSFSQKNMLRA